MIPYITNMIRVITTIATITTITRTITTEEHSELHPCRTSEILKFIKTQDYIFPLTFIMLSSPSRVSAAVNQPEQVAQ